MQILLRFRIRYVRTLPVPEEPYCLDGGKRTRPISRRCPVGLPNSRLQLAAKIPVRMCLGATRGSLALATIVLLAPVWHAGEVTAKTNAAAAEA